LTFSRYASIIDIAEKRDGMAQFATAKRDTNITRMSDEDIEYSIPEGKWMFHITSPNEVKYLQLGEIALWDLETGGVCYGYAGDWDAD
jgi:hypothetical protein